MHCFHDIRVNGLIPEREWDPVFHVIRPCRPKHLFVLLHNLEDTAGSSMSSEGFRHCTYATVDVLPVLAHRAPQGQIVEHVNGCTYDYQIKALTMASHAIGAATFPPLWCIIPVAVFVLEATTAIATSRSVWGSLALELRLFEGCRAYIHVAPRPCPCPCIRLMVLIASARTRRRCAPLSISSFDGLFCKISARPM